ncbi:hypothetical protein DYBT9623_05314 [Dyadobacter sp. CECT 9623]|uniref:Uncharacterized protein n=1 Tax=Dyadobacter linearis TaxID=2823330 RepID=A0ABN7RES9_9BACT|nr:hypothetical protein DYBT9623_05314 [Dyadobacter sp. CECT 9623]
MIHIFKTNVETKPAIERLKSYLDQMDALAQWNFDLEDCDHILRIESKRAIGHLIINLLHENGFECQELID